MEAKVHIYMAARCTYVEDIEVFVKFGCMIQPASKDIVGAGQDDRK